MSSRVDFYRSTRPNLDFKGFGGAELKLEHDEIKRNERGGVYTNQFLDFQLECSRIWKNTSFYSDFGRNYSIEMIYGYDGMVHRGPFQLNRSRPISIDGQDAL